jgi:hypothetical protein
MGGYVQSEKVRTKAPLKALEFVETFEEPAVFILGGQDRLPYFEVIRRIRGVNAKARSSTSTLPSTIAAATT